jgi:hypothetical protein
VSTDHDLAQAGSALDLIPGSPGAILGGADGMRDWANVLDEAASGFSKLDPADWTGAAADAFRRKIAPQPAKWRTAAASFGSASNAVTEYGYALKAAQGRAGAALTLYQHGLEVTAQARAEFEAQVQAHKHQLTVATGGLALLAPPQLTFHDPGASLRSEAVANLDAARESVTSAGDTAAHAVKIATQDAPQEPSFWDDVTSTASDLVDDGTKVARAAYNNVLVPGANGLADFGAAMVHNPGDTLQLLGGLALIDAGAGLEGGGFLLDATGLGAIVGVPANVAGAFVIAAGAGLTANGAGNLMRDAGKEDMHVMHASSDGAEVQINTDRSLGNDPAKGGKYQANEYDTAIRVQQERQITLERDPSGIADWRDVNTGTTYDALGNFDGRYFDAQWSRLQSRIIDHLQKAEFLPVDVSRFDPAQRALVTTFIKDNGLAPRVFVVGGA